QQHQQQNSTFIDDNLDTCPSLLNLPESPILPPKHQHHKQQQQQRQCQNEDNNNNNKHSHYNKPSAALMKRLVDAPGPSQNKRGSKASGSGQHTSAASRRQRHRSISLYGVNSTVEQGHKEIPIWLDDNEPRYVSGVTNKTTCNDIIKALIDDELSNSQDGGFGATAASRDYNDYVITERWRGIERSYDGNMAILPVWRAWSRVHNELRLTLKARRDLREPLPLQLEHKPSTSTNSFFMLKWLKKLLHLAHKKQKSNKKAESTQAKTKEKCLLKAKQPMPDELLLILLPDQHYEKPIANENAKTNAKAKLYKLAENRTAQRRRRRSRSSFKPDLAANNCVRRRRKDIPLRMSVRNKLAALHAEMNVHYEREYNLTRQLTEKCKQYKLQNEQYKSQEMEMSVGQLQRNIESYADDIIKTEHELLELRNEIKHDISLINNLKRMTLEAETDVVSTGKPVATKSSEQTPQVAKSAAEMQFVDNIYEFCDNNASMLV
ncbi:CG32150, partial [Drosophila busckii]